MRFGVWLAAALLAGFAVSADAVEADAVRSGGWFSRDKFGMFICWGVSSAAKSTWKDLGIVDPDKAVGDPSWYFARYRVPIEKWRRLAERFDPKRFDADAWVKAAKAAGMRYIVFTAKHHDGFAMYNSQCSTFDVVDVTPFGRDPLAELAESCRRNGVRLCVYYSHAQDWEHPDGANAFTWVDSSKKSFARYFEAKCKPQVREILDNYGPVGLLWFDTPSLITPAQSKELYDFVKAIQPDCLVSGRIGGGYGDYVSMADNQFPEAVIGGLWETASRSSNKWYFQEDDTDYMSSEEIIRRLVENVSRGGNLLLNFSPDYDGVIRPESAGRLAEVGRWMERNGEAIYETQPTPYLTSFDWGTITTRPGYVYLHLFRWPGERLTLNGLTNAVHGAALLCNGHRLAYRQRSDPATGFTSLEVDLPSSAPDPVDSVVKLKIDGDATVQDYAVPQQGGVMRLDASLMGGALLARGPLSKAVPSTYARMHLAESGEHMALASRGGGHIVNWLRPQEYLTWETLFERNGEYDVYVITSKNPIPGKSWPDWAWDGGHRVEFGLGTKTVVATIADHKVQVPQAVSDPKLDKITRLGTVSVPGPGAYTATLRLLEVAGSSGAGFTLRSVVLVPAPQ